jgi:hypothetical protein
LEELSLRSCSSVSAAGWISFASLLSKPHSGLKKLCLDNNAIDDDVMVALSSELDQNSSLEHLSVGASTLSITVTGWEALSGLLRKKDIGLCELLLFDNHISDQALAILANGLTGNTKLRRLSVKDQTTRITERGWRILRDLLCNTSSINSIRYSNHTLCDLNVSARDPHKPPKCVMYLLCLNGMYSESESARVKVLVTGNFDLNALAGDQLKLLPYSISWFGRDFDGRSALYDMLRRMPGILDHDKQMRPRRSKRTKRYKGSYHL